MTQNPQIPDFTLLSPEAAPFIYADGVAAFGVHNGAIQIELVAGMVCRSEDGQSTCTKFVLTGHLRCSPAAAMALRDSLQGAIDMHALAAAPVAENPGGKFN